jgi:hypothetical protein
LNKIVLFYPKSPLSPNGQSANKAHLEAFFISFQKIIALKTPHGGRGQELLVAEGLLNYLITTCITSL